MDIKCTVVINDANDSSRCENKHAMSITVNLASFLFT